MWAGTSDLDRDMAPPELVEAIREEAIRTNTLESRDIEQWIKGMITPQVAEVYPTFEDEDLDFTESLEVEIQQSLQAGIVSDILVRVSSILDTHRLLNGNGIKPNVDSQELVSLG